jgi:hypothetical protein
LFHLRSPSFRPVSLSGFCRGYVEITDYYFFKR